MDNPYTFTRIAKAGAIITEMALTVVAGAYAGFWLDEIFDTATILLLTLTVSGLIGGMFRLTSSLKQFTNN